VRVKLGTVTVNAIVVVAVSEPEVPVIVTFAVPATAELLAVKVKMLVPLVGFVPHNAVTPLGTPVTARLTLPVNPLMGITTIVDIAEVPRLTERMDGEAASVKLGLWMVKAKLVVCVKLPEVPVTVTVDVPTVAELLAVSVNTLLPVVGFVPHDAVTPLGKPAATRLTLPVNP